MGAFVNFAMVKIHKCTKCTIENIHKNNLHIKIYEYFNSMN